MIRKITKNDINAVNELIKEFDYHLEFCDLGKDFFNSAVYIADDVICGVLIYEIIYDRIEIDYIIVKKEKRNNGIASDLMKYLLNIEVDDKINNITLEVNKNNISAINLYKKFKFNVVSIRKNYYNGEDGYLMIRKFDSNER